ncbi:MAG TPA: hypothetical protein VG318_12640 [Actinomycetota bacterium]|nr:hypothetical protein [Actinomycetota bacterium]
MIYLVIMFLVAGTGLASLWVQQRRERAHLGTVDGFKDSLERLSAAPTVRPRRRPAPRAAAPAPRRSPVRAPHSSRRAPMDPARRAAARKRIEARRRAAAARSQAR